MKKIITYTLLAIALFFSSNAFAQKIKTKKGITYIDKVPYLKIVGSTMIENQPAKFVHYNTDKLFLVFTSRVYTVNGEKKFYGEVRFADVDVTFNTNTIYMKTLIKNLYDNKILTENGEFERKALDDYIRLYNFVPPVEND